MTYRSILEVGKFLPWKDAMKGFSEVSREWNKASNTDELWHSFLDQRDCENGRLSTSSPKESFRLTFQRFLPVVNNQMLTLYEFKTSRISQFALVGKAQIDCTSVWVWLPGDEIFCAGAEQHALVYRIRPPEYAVESLPSMTQQRGWFAALSYRGFVYVFGGFYTGWQFTKKCEKFDLRREHWVALPDMERARSSFNATRWRMQVFVCGGWENVYSEVFDLQSEVFKQLPFVIEESSRTLCWATNGELHILQNTRVYRIPIAKITSTPGKQKRVPALRSYIWTNTPPVEVQGKLYYLVWDNGCGFSFDLRSDEVDNVFSNYYR